MRWSRSLVMLLLIGTMAVGGNAGAQDDPHALLLEVIGGLDDPAAQAQMLAGMLKGLKGQTDVKPPAVWAEVYPKFSRSTHGDLRRVAEKLARIFGDAGATTRALAVAADAKAPMVTRREAIASLANQQNPELLAILPSLLSQPGVRRATIRAIVSYDDSRLASALLSRYATFDDGDQRAAIETLAARRTYASKLLEALLAKEIPKTDVPAYLARTLSRLLGSKFTAFWGKVRAIHADKAKLQARYKKLLTEKYLATGNASNGRRVFSGICAACHTLFGAGGKLGPDLTGSNRGDLNYILYQMIDPNDDVPDAYRMVIIELKDGLVVAGRITEEDGNKVVLQTTVEQKTILKKNIKDRQVSPISMMPEGLLLAFKDADVRDLILYLRSNKQVAMPAGK